MTVGSLSQVLAGCAQALGLPTVHSPQFPQAQSVVLCLIDGLGAQQLRHYQADAPTLSALQMHSGVDAKTVFPSTTATALASLGTGLDPGQHGLVGSAFWLPEIDQMLFPLKWGREPNPLIIQPEPTLLQAMVRGGVEVVTVGPAAYRDSGLTQAALRGGRYVAAETRGDRIHAVQLCLAEPSRTFVYCYWPHLDRVGHEYGVGSTQWRESLAEVDALVAGLVETLRTDQLLVVTADHGMVNCPQDRRCSLESRPSLMAGVRRIAGDPRARHIYLDVEQDAPQVALRWAAELSGIATVMAKEEAIETGLFGAVDAVIADRLGDVLAIAEDDWLLSSRVDQRVSGLIGQHGGLSPAECLIPVLHARG